MVSETAATDLPTPIVEGWVDDVRNGFLNGWAWLPARPDQRLELTVRLNGEDVARGTATEPRGSLEQLGIGDGAYGFAIELPAVSGDATLEVLTADHGIRIPFSADFTYEPRPGEEAATLTAAEREADEAPRVLGYVEELTQGVLEGWAFDRERPRRRLELAVTFGGEEVAVVVADQYREDLAAGRFGDGRHCFRLDLGDAAAELRAPLRVLDVETEDEIPIAAAFTATAPDGSPLLLENAQEDAAAAGPAPHGTLVAKEDWLFDVSAEFDALRGVAPVPADRIAALIAALRDERASLPEDIRYLVAVLPERLNIHPDAAPEGLDIVGKATPGELFAAAVFADDDLELVELTPVLRRAAATTPVVLRSSDSLTWNGAHVVARAIIKHARGRGGTLPREPLTPQTKPVDSELALRRLYGWLDGALRPLAGMQDRSVEEEPVNQLRADAPSFAPEPDADDGEVRLEHPDPTRGGRLAVLHEADITRVLTVLADAYSHTTALRVPLGQALPPAADVVVRLIAERDIPHTSGDLPH